MLEALRGATKGLVYTSETDAPLEPFAWKGQGDTLTDAQACELAGADDDETVE